jgi:beta-galactosidase
MNMRRISVWVMMGWMMWGCSNGAASTEGTGTDSETSADTDVDGDADGDGDTDADSDTDTDADSDADTDADGDADGDADTDSDTDGDGDADTDADGDTDTDADNDTDTDADGDSDTDTDVDTDTDSDSDTDTDADADSDTDTDTDADTITRVTMPFDADWRFNKGDAPGADETAFDDSAWRSLSVPHDWSIEGPYDQNASTGAAGGYLPTGIGWYRKHFMLPDAYLGRRIFIEFDGVMANSTVYVNGTSVGTRPFGYVSFRYEITDQVSFGATENVVAVKVDNTPQPASRWYTGAGIYRRVRLIAASPVHMDQWAAVVTTPSITTDSATVHVQTTVVNQGDTPQSVSVKATVTDPNGTSLSPVTSIEQSIAAGASADFGIDVPVANPLLWSLESPTMYQAALTVLSGSTAVDNEVTPFGIRTIEFNPETGFFLNGVSTKMKGVCLHHDMSGLGAAVPLRAVQRRLAILKGLGVNAVRTSHNPVSPDVLDLYDRMGFLVLDEFFDAWKANKESADYGDYFNEWWETDLRDTLKRDRNHPSIVFYSIGNEIRDSLSTRMPIATDMVRICHELDPTRPVTQALFRPQTNGDYPGNMVDILDVFGANYRTSEVQEAISATPHHAGVVTEIGSDSTSTWSAVENDPQLVGEFLWTGVDYLGESAGWPQIGFYSGIIDRVGTIKDLGYTYQAMWSDTPVDRPTTAASGAANVVLSVDHSTVTADWNDIAYVKATITNGLGAIVTNASNTVTFEIEGSAGSIVAVDSGTDVGESYRGADRNAYKGICFALVQMIAAGTVTITASSPGLTGSSITVTGEDTSFVPCSGTCD